MHPQLPDATPFVLHPAYELADFKLVRAHWTKHFLRRFGADEPVHALMARVLHQIRADGYAVRERYAFPLADVTAPPLPGATRQEQAHRAVDQLNGVVFGFRTPTGQDFHLRHLLDGTAPRPTGGGDAAVTVSFNPHLGPYLRNVAQLDEMLPAPPPRRGAKTAARPARR